jgi:hypothetical protein
MLTHQVIHFLSGGFIIRACARADIDDAVLVKFSLKSFVLKNILERALQWFLYNSLYCFFQINIFNNNITSGLVVSILP